MAGPKRKAKKKEDLWDDEEPDRGDDWMEGEEDYDKYYEEPSEYY